MNLVSSILKWLKNKENLENLLVLADLPSFLGDSKPPAIEGYYPDVWAKEVRSGFVAIGEAKTARDIENRHSTEQFGAFLRYCNALESAVLVVAVPWMMVNCAKAHIRRIKKNTNTQAVNVVFLAMLPA
jgi:hypothetical protein